MSLFFLRQERVSAALRSAMSDAKAADVIERVVSGEAPAGESVVTVGGKTFDVLVGPAVEIRPQTTAHKPASK